MSIRSRTRDVIWGCVRVLEELLPGVLVHDASLRQAVARLRKHTSSQQMQGAETHSQILSLLHTAPYSTITLLPAAE